VALDVLPFDACHQQGVIDTILPIQREEFGVDVTLEDQPDLLDIPGYYRAGRGNFWVAVDAGQVVGTLALLDVGGGDGALRKMFVRASHRGAKTAGGAGAAHALLSTLADWARANGFSRVFLGTTAKYLAAHRFYEKNGFTRVERGDLPPSMPVMKVDTIFYMISLAAPKQSPE